MKKGLIALGVLLTPSLAFAQGAQQVIPGLQGVVNVFRFVLSAIVPIIISLALIYFLWGVVSYVIRSAPDDKENAKKQMIYGIIGLFVMISVWGLVKILQDTFFSQGGNNQAPQGPMIPNIPQQ